MKKKSIFVDQKINTKIIIMSAWITLMCLYIYCDILSLFRPGVISSIKECKMGFLDVSQLSLFTASLLMVIPSMMILISIITRVRVNRIINLTVSVLYFIVNAGNLVGESWGYYFLFGLFEIGVVIFIFITSLKWPVERKMISQPLSDGVSVS